MKCNSNTRLQRGSRARGFSLLEMVMVVAISLIIAGVAIPHFLSAYYSIRLRAQANDLAGFIQRARINAARTNSTYTIGYTTAQGVQEAYLDLNLNGQWDPGEPKIVFGQTAQMAAGAPAGGGGQPIPYVLVGDTAGVTYTNSTTLGYSPRGLPCAYAAPNCPTPAAGYFVYYLTDTNPTGTNWGGVVITRSGRTKVVIWNGAAWQ